MGVLDERQPLLKFVGLGLLDGDLRVRVFFQGVGMRLEWMCVLFEGVGMRFEWMCVGIQSLSDFVHSYGKLFYACRCGDPILLDTRWNDHSIYY